MTRNDKLLLSLFQVTIFLMLCWGCHAWFTWDLDYLNSKLRLAIIFIFFVISMVYKSHFRINFVQEKILFIGIICFVLARCFPLQNFSALIESSLYGFFTVFPICVLLSDRYNAQKHLDYVNKYLSLFLGLGLLMWILVSFVNFIPGLPISYDNGYESYVFYNYGIMLKSAFWQHIDSNRFQSIFIEPGTLGQLSAIMLYANRFDLSKRCNKIYLLACLFSFSLAGYVIAFLAYALITYQKVGMIKSFFIIPFVLVSVYFFGITYNDGKNDFNEKILARLELDEEKGIAGNDRFHGDTDHIYEVLSNNGGLLFGDARASKKYDISGAGYKIFFITNGIVSSVLYLFSFLFFVCCLRNKTYSLGFLFLLIAIFVQASHPASYSSILPFALGLSSFDAVEN